MTDTAHEIVAMDCRGQRIEVGDKVVVSTHNMRLAERTVYRLTQTSWGVAVHYAEGSYNKDDRVAVVEKGGT